MSKSSACRIKRFVDCFIRSEYVANWLDAKDSDFFNEPERASRVYDAAETGSDGRLHSEIIDDWREAFKAWIRDRRMWTEPERFVAAVEAHFDRVEAWHESNGTLESEVG
jgi:hypothetical protein